MPLARSVIVAFTLLAGCAVMATSKMHSLQDQFSCGMSQAQVEAIVGERLQTIEKDRRVTHFYRSGMADLWLVFTDGKLRSSQVIKVKGFTGTEDEPVVNHCR
jgi:hypothetical protein